MKLKPQTTYILLCIFLLSNLTVFATAHPSDNFLHLTGTIQYIPIEGGFWGIVGDDGKNYQPTRLPNELKKEGTVVKWVAQVRDDNFMSSIMWGTIVELKKIESISSSISNEERSAIYILSRRMEAFNSKSLVQLQQIDISAQELSQKQLTDWIGNYGNFTLKYVDIVYASTTTIQGTCFYTRELMNAIALNGNISLTGIDFTLRKTPSGWMISNIHTLKASEAAGKFSSLTDLEEQTKLKYGTTSPSELLN